MPKQVLRFAIVKVEGEPPFAQLKDENGREIWYDTRKEAEEALEKIKNKKNLSIEEQKFRVA
jgi:hypothetical protein